MNCIVRDRAVTMSRINRLRKIIRGGIEAEAGRGNRNAAWVLNHL